MTFAGFVHQGPAKPREMCSKVRPFIRTWKGRPLDELCSRFLSKYPTQETFGIYEFLIRHMRQVVLNMDHLNYRAN